MTFISLKPYWVASDNKGDITLLNYLYRQTPILGSAWALVWRTGLLSLQQAAVANIIRLYERFLK